MKYNKGFIGIGMIVAIIAILAVGGGVVYYATKSPAPSSNIKENSYPPVTQNQNSTIPPTNINTQTQPVTAKPAASISVLSPSAGERISAGSAFSIKWNSANTSNRVLLILHLSSIQQIIAPDSGADVTVVNNGSFTWKVPKSFDELNSTPVDHDYIAYITIQDSQNKNIVGQSKNFIITPSATTANPSITVTSPNGGDVWKIGQTYLVTTKSSGNLGTKTIRLNRYSDDGVRVGSETIGTTEDDSFSYKVPSGIDQTRGMAARYKIQVIINKYDSGMGVADESDNYFTINN